jgi:hypothetical protein
MAIEKSPMRFSQSRAYRSIKAFNKTYDLGIITGYWSGLKNPDSRTPTRPPGWKDSLIGRKDKKMREGRLLLGMRETSREVLEAEESRIANRETL